MDSIQVKAADVVFGTLGQMPVELSDDLSHDLFPIIFIYLSSPIVILLLKYFVI